MSTTELTDLSITNDLAVTGNETVAGDMTVTGEVTGASLTVGSQGKFEETTQAMTADNAITIKNGVVTLDKAGVLAATLASPTATTDDYKRLLIVGLQAQANTITPAAAFGNGGAGENLATASGVIGDSLELMAYQGYWYITGSHQMTIS